MPLKSMPTFTRTDIKRFQIEKPAVGGLNLKDLEYEQNANQSPYMLNMMYRNGAFSKRYGQAKILENDFANEIYASIYFNSRLIVHSGTKIYSVDIDTYEVTEIPNTSISSKSGMFAIFSQNLYYLCDKVIYEYKYKDDQQAYVWGEIDAYIPDHITNAEPAKTGAWDVLEDLNIVNNKFNIIYNGDGQSLDYYIHGDDDNIIDWDKNPVIKVDDVEKTLGTDYTIDKVNKKITFVNASKPSANNLNVVMTFETKTSVMEADRNRILNSKYNVTYGGNNNSCLFLAGGGDSKYFYSDAYDATYFPESNWAIIGNSEEDITGFGLQYNILLIFKPKEIYSIVTYTAVKLLNDVETEYETFKAMVVNPRIGCDCPNTIQLINNQLTWFNSIWGVCTLVSTNIVDERNVRPISRNVDRTNNMGVRGILDFNENLNEIQSVDYDNKYFLVFPSEGMTYVWDYELSPYVYTSSKVTDEKSLAWFLFDNFFVKSFSQARDKLFYISSKSEFNKNLVLLNDTFEDLDFNGDGNPDGINCHYMTPFLQFDAVEYLKTITNIYVQCRGDTSSVIDMYYLTDENLNPEQDPESIRIGGKIWSHFSWDNFEWLVVNWANTFRRKCGLKKVQMASFYFENKDTTDTSVAGRDMSITHISLDYQLVKTIK